MIFVLNEIKSIVTNQFRTLLRKPHDGRGKNVKKIWMKEYLSSGETQTEVKNDLIWFDKKNIEQMDNSLIEVFKPNKKLWLCAMIEKRRFIRVDVDVAVQHFMKTCYKNVLAQIVTSEIKWLIEKFIEEKMISKKNKIKLIWWWFNRK